MTQADPNRRRVVITGMAGVTALGEDWPSIKSAMQAGRVGIRRMHEWDRLHDLRTRLGGVIDSFDHTKIFPRKKARSMGRVSVMSVWSAEKALRRAGLLDEPVLRSGRCGVAFGSSYGSTPPTHDFVHFVESGNAGSLNATSYVRMMSHTTAVNIGIMFGLQGRIITTSSACTSGSQGIGYAYEAIRNNSADIMIAGGAEELCPSMAVVFDTLFATSLRNDSPDSASRPFDQERDGLVIGEGAGALVLEELSSAQERGAEILAEISGFWTNSDGAHITQPTAATQEVAMRQALADAGMAASDIEFISGHGTATETGDVAEAASTYAVFRDDAPLHSLKGHFGHTLGACGAIEAWLALEMMRDGWFPATANLANVDPRCAGPAYLMGEGRELDIDVLLSNNFAFGGINTSLVFRRF
ncbi:MAG: beta-ketoacyl-ACP synthase [Pseudomonadota bacterium]